MEAWIEFGRGPLFRAAFALMVLGLLRILVLTTAGILEAYLRSPDKIINWADTARQTLGWLFPFARLLRKRPFYSAASFVFHAGLLVVPLFLAAHALLWERSIGFAWASIPQQLADWLTLATIFTGLGLFAGRLLSPASRSLSRPQDYAWPLLLVVPFASGYLCSNTAIGPAAYRALMLVHIYSAALIMAMIPFTKIAHCVLAPLSQVVTAVAWKFVPGAGDRVAATLGHADRPVWVEKSRLSGSAGESRGEQKEVPVR